MLVILRVIVIVIDTSFHIRSEGVQLNAQTVGWRIAPYRSLQLDYDYEHEHEIDDLGSRHFCEEFTVGDAGSEDSTSDTAALTFMFRSSGFDDSSPAGVCCWGAV